MRLNNTRFGLLSTALLAAFLTNNSSAQPGFERGDVVTFADSRLVNSADFSDREVFFATNGGLWKLNRNSGTMLDPEYQAYGLGKSIPFGSLSHVLFHRQTATLWVSGSEGLFMRETGLDHWTPVWGVEDDVQRLGERNDTLFLMRNSKLYGIAVFGRRDLGWLKDTGAEGIRWSPGNIQKSEINAFPFYHTFDPAFRYDPDRGRLVDRDLNEFNPVFSLIDPFQSRRYIGYRKLGIGVGDDRRGSIEVFRTGPAGRVGAIALGKDGDIFTGGVGDSKRDGISRFDRRTGNWQPSGRRERWGGESNQIYDLAFYKESIYAASDEGLLVGNGSDWSLYGLLEGAPKPPVWLVEIVGDQLIVGGSSGLRVMHLPKGPFEDLKTPGDAELYAADGDVDGDSIWLAGPQGLFYATIEGGVENMGAGPPFSEMPSRAVVVTAKSVVVGGSYGLYFYDRKTGDWREMPERAHFNSGQVIALAARDEAFFVGTDRGLFYYNDATGKVLPFGFEQGLPNQRVDELTFEADTLWVGTRAGLTRINLNARYWR